MGIRQEMHEVRDSGWVTTGARVGYAASGVLHALLGWLTLQLALSATRNGDADQGGAFKALASSSTGKVLLYAVVVGLALLALWNLLEAAFRHRIKDRLKTGAKGVVYLVIAWTGLSAAQARGADGDDAVRDAASSVLSSPGGQLVLGAVALVLVGVAAYHVHKGLTRRFLRDLREQPPPWVVRLAQVGYVAKGVTFVAVAGLVGSAALHEKASEAGGLDDALRSLLRVPLGWALVAVIGVGFVAYAAYSVARARYARV